MTGNTIYRFERAVFVPVPASYLFISFLLIVLLLLSGCGGGSSGGGDNGDLKATISRIEISPAGMLLTEVNDTRQLSAQAYDDNDQLIPDIVFTWSSNDAPTISIDSNGLATAQSGLGSAQITAAAEGIKSPPVTALVALPVADAVLIDDAQVVVAPTLVDPNADLQLGLQFIATLDGTTVPEVGDTIVGTGVHPIGGVVVASEVQGNGTVIVTYELVSLDELFSSLLLEETYDFTNVPFDLGEEAAKLYDLEDLGEGTARLTLKPQTTVAATSGIRTQKFKLSIFECESTVTPPFKLKTNPGVINLVNSATMSMQFAVPTTSVTDLELARLDGEIRADFKADISLTSQLSVEVKCEAPDMVSKTIPLPGFLVLLSPTVGLGPNVALGGKIETDSLEFELTADAKAKGFIEFRCPASSLSDCVINADYNAPTPKADYKINVPDIDALANIKLQPELSAGVTGTISFGVPPKFKRFAKWLGKLTLEAAKGSLGLKQTGDLALVKTQIEDDAYASDYKLVYEWEVGAGEDIEKLLKFLSKSSGTSIPTSKSGGDDLATSPKAISAMADTDSFRPGDNIKFTIELDSNTTDYPFTSIYNVDQIKIYHKNILDEIKEIASVTSTDGQTTFDMTWTADTNGSIDTEKFYAFVKTDALPVPYIGELELAKILAAATNGGWGAAEIIAGDGDNEFAGGNTSITIDANGNALAVWLQASLIDESGEKTRDNLTPADVWASRYTIGSGWGTAELIDTNDAGSAVNPQIVADAAGNAMVMWIKAEDDIDGAPFNTWFNNYTAGGDWGTATLFAENNASLITANTSDKAVAVWAKDGNTWINRYTLSSGWGPAELIETGNNNTTHVQIAIDNTGNILAVWFEDNGGQLSIWANRYAVDSGWGVAESFETGGIRIYTPHITINAVGDAFVVWRQEDAFQFSIKAIQYTVDSGLGTPELIENNTVTAWNNPKIAVDAAGNALAVWVQNDDTSRGIWANHYSTVDGWGESELLETNAGVANNPQIAINASGNALAVWDQFGSSGRDIFSNHYTVGDGWGTAESIDTTVLGPGINSSVIPQIVIDPAGKALAVWSRQIEIEEGSDTYNDTIQANRFE